MTNKATDLQDLVALSRAMLEKAREKSWDDVFELEQRRRELMQLFFSEPVAVEDAQSVSTGIQEVMAIDRELMVLASQAKAELGDALHKLGQGKKAVKAYTG